MAKADKATVIKRTNEVLKLLLAGAEFEDIRQYASDKGWQLCYRQIRRYLEWAYKRLAKATHRDQEQLLGRHLMQRRALYARALKTNDIRTALNVLRDEASLEGLYPPTKIAPTTPDGKFPYQFSSGPPLSLEERFFRYLAAQHREDTSELRLLEQATPLVYYRLPDTMMPLQLLYIMALIYVALQLDHAGMVLLSTWQVLMGEDEVGNWEFIGECHAYRFKVEFDGWEQFTESIGADSQKLIADNHRGSLLELFADRIYELAPTKEELIPTLDQQGISANYLPTPESVAQEWHNLLNQVLHR